MRRKIAAILVAHIADYGRLVADDEEETLRRMASCRRTTDEFIAIAGGRIFNTAGDAVLAEFPIAVEAVRCAIDWCVMRVGCHSGCAEAVYIRLVVSAAGFLLHQSDVRASHPAHTGHSLFETSHFGLEFGRVLECNLVSQLGCSFQ
jgi:hypothetical protein